jgi:hypothetical protein
MYGQLLPTITRQPQSHAVFSALAFLHSYHIFSAVKVNCNYFVHIIYLAYYDLVYTIGYESRYSGSQNAFYMAMFASWL